MVDLYCDEILTGHDLGHMTPDDGYQSTTKDYLHALPSVRRAQLDPVLIDDERVFRNMMNTEEFKWGVNWQQGRKPWYCFLYFEII